MGVTWTPKVCKIMALRAILRGLGLLFYILLGFRYGLPALVTIPSQLARQIVDSMALRGVGVMVA